MLCKMIDAGMDIARFNCNADLRTLQENYDNLRAAMNQRKEKNIAVMVDLKGPEIITGMNRDNKPIELIQG